MFGLFTLLPDRLPVSLIGVRVRLPIFSGKLIEENSVPSTTPGSGARQTPILRRNCDPSKVKKPITPLVVEPDKSPIAFEADRLGDRNYILDVLPSVDIAPVEILPNRMTFSAHHLVDLKVTPTPDPEVPSARKDGGQQYQDKSRG